MSRSPSQDDSMGRLFVVSIGPGDLDNMTPLAKKTVGESDVVIGNGFYLDQIRPLLDGKKVITSAW